MTDAACTAINTAIIRESGRISPEIYTRVVRGSPWIALTPRDVWPDGMGLTQSSMTFERMLPADDNEAWVNVAPSDGNSNNCLPATEILKWGQSLATWSLEPCLPGARSEPFIPATYRCIDGTCVLLPDID